MSAEAKPGTSLVPVIPQSGERSKIDVDLNKDLMCLVRMVCLNKRSRVIEFFLMSAFIIKIDSHSL